MAMKMGILVRRIKIMEFKLECILSKYTQRFLEDNVAFSPSKKFDNLIVTFQYKFIDL